MRNYEHAASVLSEWFEERGISASEFAKMTQIDAGTVRNILAGRQKNISTRNMLIIARYFDLSLQELIDRLA